MSRKGNCWDNSVLESFFSSLKRELLDDKPFESRCAARHALFEDIEVFDNRRRRHSTLASLTPLEFERQTQVASPMLRETDPCSGGNWRVLEDLWKAIGKALSSVSPKDVWGWLTAAYPSLLL